MQKAECEKIKKWETPFWKVPGGAWRERYTGCGIRPARGRGPAVIEAAAGILPPVCGTGAGNSYPIFAKRSTAFVKFSIVLSTYTYIYSSRTQCWIWPSRTIWPTLWSADLAALI